MRANFVVSGVVTGIRRNVTMTIALILSTSIALAAVGATYLLSTEITRFKASYEGRLNASVYLCSSTSNGNCKHKTTVAETNALRTALENDPMVKSVKYVSEAEQIRRFDETRPPDVARLTAVGDLPASFTVKLVDINKDFDAFVAKYKDQPGVSGTTNASAALKTLLKFIDGGRLFSIVVAIVVLVASILLIANSIQVAAAQRKNETSIMRLVGASRWMTELPFMLETIFSTIVGGLIALGMISLGKHFVLNGIFKSPVDNGVIPDLSTNDVLIAGGIGLIAGIVLAGLTAFATLRLYVRL
ncbi:MAG TPA: permease-like cell division protein FtsX [Jatrophihabitans sp.]|jgi:cell division transport system permease protein|nr:permease-like cell division protein FtsX [Jatrophihabitans sp.]